MFFIGMGVSLKLTNLWRVIREVDLEAIRASARAPFSLLIVDDGDGQAARLRALLGPDRRVAHPWIRIARAEDVVRSAAGEIKPRSQALAPSAAGAGIGAGRATTPAPAPAPADATATAGATGGVHTPELLPPAFDADIDPFVVLPTLAVILSAQTMLSNAQQAAAHALRRARVPFVVAVLGSDGPSKTLSHGGERWIGVAALDEQAAQAVGAALVDLAPVDLRLALARQLPPLRPAVFEATIEETAKANASYALTSGLAEVVPVLNVPLNLGDMVVLTKNQLIMSYRLVLAAGRDGEPRKLLGEILAVLGGGMLFRQAARQLVGLIPIAGLVPKIAIAYGGTWAIGRAVTLWVTEGREVTSELVRTMSAEGVERGRSVAQRLVDQAKSSGTRAGARWDRLKANLPLIGRRRA